MDIPKLKLVSILVLIALASNATSAQDNAIGGQVRLRGSEKPLGQAQIKVAQMPEVRYTTDDKDGVYVLIVPKSLKKFDLIYEHDNCFRVADEGIANEQAQNKRPVRELRSSSTAAVRDLTPEELNEIVDRAKEMTLHSLETQTVALWEAGQTNLRMLSTTAETIGNEAVNEAEKGDVAKAETSYKTAIAILEKTRPASYQFARLLDQYAALLRKTGRPTLADQQVARAKEVRLQARSYEEAMTAQFQIYGDFKAYHAWNDSVFGRNRSRNDKFALEHLESLPNLEGTITLLTDKDGQFGRITAPGRGSASFRVHIEDQRVPFLRILTKTEVAYAIEVTGDKGRIEATHVANLITWSAETSKTFTVTIRNKDPKKQDYVVNLSAWRQGAGWER